MAFVHTVEALENPVKIFRWYANAGIAYGKLDTVGGRLFCPDCPAPATAIPLSEQALALLRRMGDLPDEKLFSFSASGAALRELYFAAERYLLDQTDLHPRSLKFFRSLQGETP